MWLKFRTVVSGPIFCPETSVRNYYRSLRNVPEDRRSHFSLIQYTCCQEIHCFLLQREVANLALLRGREGDMYVERIGLVK
jgi:hypothetical protein